MFIMRDSEGEGTRGPDQPLHPPPPPFPMANKNLEKLLKSTNPVILVAYE